MFGNNVEYKQVQRVIPICTKCESSVMGNGSILTPYYCKCGTYEYIKGVGASSNGVYELKK